MEVKIDVKDLGLVVGHLVIENLENKKNPNKKLKRIISTLREEVQKNPEKFLNKDEIKAYKEFINSNESIIKSKEVGPTILVNLILKNGFLPSISRVVDCMNVISIKNGLTISIWNQDKVRGNITYSLSKGGEKYWPFMGEEVELLENELVAVDDEKVLCLVRYRDSKYTPVELDTKNIVVHIQGVKGISKDNVENALNELEELLNQTTGGKTVEKKTILE